MTTVTVHEYAPRGACRTLFEHRGGEVLLSGPAGTGKSRACLEKLNLLMLANPGARGLIVRKTAASLGSTALVTWREHVIPEALANGTVWYYGGSSEEPPQYRYSNGSKVMIGGMDKPSKIMSSEYDVAYAQEAIELTVTDWEAITTRLRNGVISFHQLMADTNPSTPKHWLKARCDEGACLMLSCRHSDNPVLIDDDGNMTDRGRDYLGKLDKLTGVRRLRLKDGKWVAAEGQIYEGWDEAVHVIDRFPVPADWVRWWVVDFGYRNPFVCQFWAEDHDGRLYLYREIYMTGRLVEDHARQALDLVTDDDGNWTEPRPRAVICDHDAEDRATLERYLGMSTVAADKRVKVGIEAVQARLRVDDTGRAALFILRDSVVERDPALEEAVKPACTAEEVPGYIWMPTPDGKPNKEEPLKVDDHGCDCIRYQVAQCDLGSRPRVRFL